MLSWEEKRQEILIRDNFTCQVYKKFNPELGEVQVVDENGGVELHRWFNSPATLENFYTISQSTTGYTYEINFGDCWPVFPIMQVHHKKYINGRQAWNYQNSDLLTICKNCHVLIHKSELIPIYSEDEILLEKRHFIPVDEGRGRRHQCEEWTFIKKINAGEYSVSSIHPTITAIAVQFERTDEIIEEGKKTLDKFIRKYFPKYSQQ